MIEFPAWHHGVWDELRLLSLHRRSFRNYDLDAYWPVYLRSWCILNVRTVKKNPHRDAADCVYAWSAKNQRHRRPIHRPYMHILHVGLSELKEGRSQLSVRARIGPKFPIVHLSSRYDHVTNYCHRCLCYPHAHIYLCYTRRLFGHRPTKTWQCLSHNTSRSRHKSANRSIRQDTEDFVSSSIT
jgi:hypothetical protein